MRILLILRIVYTITRLSPTEDGVELLSHELADVRHGAWVGLGHVDNVELVQRLDAERKESKDPLFRHAAYRAIDLILTNIESTDNKEVLPKLEKLRDKVKEEKREEVYTRVDWTILKLKGLDS